MVYIVAKNDKFHPVRADYYKIEKGVLTLYLKVKSGMMNKYTTHTKVGSFKGWDFIKVIKE